MQIAKLYTVPIGVSPRDTKLTANASKVLSFSTLMQDIVDDKTASAQKASKQKQSDLSCACDSSMKPCKCDSDKETKEVSDAKKSGIAACMECPNRTNGQCAMWNGENENGLFSLLSANSYDAATQADVAKILDIQAPLDVTAKASPEYDYTNAYAYIRKRFVVVNLE